MRMHDWTLRGIEVDWQRDATRVTVRLKAPHGPETITAQKVREICVPRANSWGPSVSVYEMTGPDVRPDGSARVSIEMQSGDVIEIVAEEFGLPSNPS